MRYLIGFFFGIVVASAGAQTDYLVPGISHSIDTYLNAGVGPDNKMAPIRVDKDGHVICSTEQPK